jgi:hypothetical protein
MVLIVNYKEIVTLEFKNQFKLKQVIQTIQKRFLKWTLIQTRLSISWAINNHLIPRYTNPWLRETKVFKLRQFIALNFLKELLLNLCKAIWRAKRLMSLLIWLMQNLKMKESNRIS